MAKKTAETTLAKLERALDGALERRIDAAFAVLAQGISNAGTSAESKGVAERNFSMAVKGLMSTHASALATVTRLLEKPEK